MFEIDGCLFVTALTWFMEHFEKCSERAVMVKTWLPAQYMGPSTYVDELVYNRALTLVRFLSLSCLVHQANDVTCRVGQQQRRSCWTSTLRLMNVRHSTSSLCGACMRCRTTSCRRIIRSWRRIGRQSRPVGVLPLLLSFLSDIFSHHCRSMLKGSSVRSCVSLGVALART